MSFLLTGQTDSGKSTISGNLLYSVGYFSNMSEEDQRYYRKHLDQVTDPNVKSRFSILMDLLDGEVLANKSKTVDFNFCSFTHEGKSYNLIDTPGHKLYIRSLINGLFHHSLDLVCLVVSSLSNEFYESFERGTIKEDLMLARSTGCTNLLIVWNKYDLNEPDKAMEAQLSSFCAKLAFKRVNNIKISGYKQEDVLKILSFVEHSNKPNITTETSLIDTNKFASEGMIFSGEQLISPGYKFVMHTRQGEIEVEVVKIKDLKTGKVVRFTKGPGSFYLLLQSESELVGLTKGTRVIFRSADTTLGFGVLV